MAINQLIGIGLRHPHYTQILKDLPAIDWLEVHSENFFQANSPALKKLHAVRQYYPISLHGVGLSLGSVQGICKKHLIRLKNLASYLCPLFISEHLSWGSIANIHLPDLLPIPYNQESLNIFCRNVTQAQECLGRELLIENPSSYLEYHSSNIKEVDFLIELCKRTGAKILLDINNIYVSSINHGWNAKEYIDTLPPLLIKEIHLAGHSEKTLFSNQILLIDTHDRSVCKEVWALYDYAIQKFGAIPTLLEWDAQIPSLDFLIKEAHQAGAYYAQS